MLPEPATPSEPADPWQTRQVDGYKGKCISLLVWNGYNNKLSFVSTLKPYVIWAAKKCQISFIFKHWEKMFWFTSPWRCSPAAAPGWCWWCLTHWFCWWDHWWTSWEPPSSSSDRPGCTGGEASVNTQIIYLNIQRFQRHISCLMSEPSWFQQQVQLKLLLRITLLLYCARLGVGTIYQIHILHFHNVHVCFGLVVF